MFFLFLFLTITCASYGYFLNKLVKKNQVQERVDFFLSNGQVYQEDILVEKPESLFKRLVKPFILEMKKGFKKRMPGEKEAKIDKLLQMAGNPFGMSPVDFRLVQLAFLCILPIIFGGYGVLLNFGMGAVMILAVLGILAGALIPRRFLKGKMKARNRMALREFPDILDLLTVSLEAGLGFDAAVTKVVSKKEGVLASEFHRCLEEIRLGKTRREALSGIRERLEVDAVNSFISSILQAEKQGIGMVKVLRAQSQEVREQRKQRAEEAAMKAPIKMLFPLVLFIFPSLFIVLLGPAILQFIAAFTHH